MYLEPNSGEPALINLSSLESFRHQHDTYYYDGFQLCSQWTDQSGWWEWMRAIDAEAVGSHPIHIPPALPIAAPVLSPDDQFVQNNWMHATPGQAQGPAVPAVL